MRTVEEDFWSLDIQQRDAVFAELRRRPTLSDEPLPRPLGSPPAAPYRSVVRYDDVWMVSRRPDVFVSRYGTNIDDDPPEFDDFFGSMLNMDDPMHARLRSIVARAFGPKQIAALEGLVTTVAAGVVDAAIEAVGSGDGDFARPGERVPVRLETAGDAPVSAEVVWGDRLCPARVRQIGRAHV